MFVDFSTAGEARMQYAIQLCRRHHYSHSCRNFCSPVRLARPQVESFVRGEGAIRRLIQRNRLKRSLPQARLAAISRNCSTCRQPPNAVTVGAEIRVAPMT